MAIVFTYPPTPNNIEAYQGVDMVYTTIIYEDEAGSTPLNLTGYSFVARFFRTTGTSVLTSTTAVNNNGVVTGQVVVTLQDSALGELDMDTIGAWDLIGTDGSGIKKLYDYGSFNVKDDPAS